MFDYIIKRTEKVGCPVNLNCPGYGDRLPIPLFKLQPHIAFKDLEDEIRNCAYRLGITDRPRTKDNKLTLATRIAYKISQENNEME